MSEVVKVGIRYLSQYDFEFVSDESMLIQMPEFLDTLTTIDKNTAKILSKKFNRNLFFCETLLKKYLDGSLFECQMRMAETMPNAF